MEQTAPAPSGPRVALLRAGGLVLVALIVAIAYLSIFGWLFVNLFTPRRG
ncbi:hypothetical protein [Stakelama marina]|uniref:Uncharacterized protein n=1 Tax=Stakelama marina TaxID=2826939 RepID=A0A8T4IEB6_9SPHN|nr:hypothetical protein [Stakelama marina]MBR0552893.1 hypothetical protein [Stakelama marina]